MKTIRVNQGSRSPFNPFNIHYTEILLPCNQDIVIFSTFAELAGVRLAPPWVLNSYSATRMLNRRIIYIYVCVCVCVCVCVYVRAHLYIVLSKYYTLLL